jgi:hypothetical protein
MQFSIQTAERQRKQEFSDLEASFISPGVHGRLQRMSGSETGVYTWSPLPGNWVWQFVTRPELTVSAEMAYPCPSKLGTIYPAD